jgi:hypothetical protein
MSRPLLFVASLLLPVTALAGDATDSHLDASAWISAPDTALAGEDFTVEFEGTIAGGSSFSVHAWSLYADAVWSYDSSHGVTITSGTLIDADGFGWGDVHADSYDIALDEGTHTLLYVFGDRDGAHDWYDVAAEVEVEVMEPACDITWAPPLVFFTRAGRTIPLKWFAYDCDSGDLWFDRDVAFRVYDSSGVLVEERFFTGNPRTGINIGPFYHVNWRTSGLTAGDYEIEVSFANGQTLESSYAVY